MAVEDDLAGLKELKLALEARRSEILRKVISIRQQNGVLGDAGSKDGHLQGDDLVEVQSRIRTVAEVINAIETAARRG